MSVPAMVKIWLSLGTKRTWLEKDYVWVIFLLRH